MGSAASSGGGLKWFIRVATEMLARIGVENPKNEAEILVSHRFKVPRNQFAMKIILDEQYEWFKPGCFHCYIKERKGKPLQHVTGCAPFRYREYHVGRGVFIPRPETELLVDEANVHLAISGDFVNGEYVTKEDPIIVDLCSGSGAIACAVGTENPGSCVYAVELSEKALPYLYKNVTKANKELKQVRPGVGGIHVVHDDFNTALSELAGSVHVVISNPPYVADETEMPEEVTLHDPHMALYGRGEAGLGIPLQVVDRAHFLLKPGGFFIMEHDETQHRAVKEYMEQNGWKNIQLHHDLTGRERATSGMKI